MDSCWSPHSKENSASNSNGAGSSNKPKKPFLQRGTGLKARAIAAKERKYTPPGGFIVNLVDPQQKNPSNENSRHVSTQQKDRPVANSPVRNLFSEKHIVKEKLSAETQLYGELDSETVLLDIKQSWESLRQPINPEPAIYSQRVLESEQGYRGADTQNGDGYSFEEEEIEEGDAQLTGSRKPFRPSAGGLLARPNASNSGGNWSSKLLDEVS